MPIDTFSLPGGGPAIRRLRLIAAGAVASIGVLLAPASVAGAATVNAPSDNVFFTASPGETNTVSVSGGPLGITITDSTSTLVAGISGCSPVNSHQVFCTGSDGSVFQVTLLLDNKADSYTSTATVVGTILGGPGNDTITGGPAQDEIIGGGGDDTIGGGGGDDFIQGTGGADDVRGGDGNDTFSYGDEVASVTMTLDEAANDGTAGEADNVHNDIETVLGSGFDDTLTGDANTNFLQGGNGNDTVNGLGGEDGLGGGSGQDTLNGGGGADTLQAGADPDGADVLFGGGSGNDTVSYALRDGQVTVTIGVGANDGEMGEGDDVKVDVENVEGGATKDKLTGSPAANRLDGGDGPDTLDGGAGGDVLEGGGGLDIVTYASRSAPVTADPDESPGDDGEAGEGDSIGFDVEQLIGGSAGDTLSGNALANTLDGGPGNDTLDGGFGADTINGGPDVDTVTYASRTAAVTADLDSVRDDGEAGENDVIINGENLIGGSGNDALTGGSGVNDLDGGPGSDVLDGGLGGDTLHGGADRDGVTYASRTLPVIAQPDGLPDSGPAGEGDLIATDVETLTGGSGADTLTGNSGSNGLNGGPGDDTLDGGLGADGMNGGADTDTVTYASRTAAVTVRLDHATNDGEAGEGDLVNPDVESITGGSGNDTLVATAGAGVLTGGAGDDTLDGGPDADVLLGGSGTDTASYASRGIGVTVTINDVADDGATGEGDNVSTDIEKLIGTTGNDSLTGSGSANSLSGGAGNDVLDGAARGDTLSGGAGVDTVTYATRTVAVTVDLDNAPDDGQAGEADNVLSDVENISGGNGGDSLTGSVAVNTILGNGGDDALVGLAAADILNGGNGADTCSLVLGDPDTRISCELAGP